MLGGKKIQMRTNYVNEIDVRKQGTSILFNNDMPKVELGPPASAQRLSTVSRFQFVFEIF